MPLTSSRRLRAHSHALEAWREAARLVSVRWQSFLDADGNGRKFAFACYVAALDAEEVAAGDVAALAA